MILYIVFIALLVVIVGLLLAILWHDSSHPPKVILRLIAESEARTRKEMQDSQQHLIDVLASDLNTINDRCGGNGKGKEPVGTADSSGTAHPSPLAPSHDETHPANSTTSTKHKRSWIDRISEKHTGTKQKSGTHMSFQEEASEIGEGHRE